MQHKWPYIVGVLISMAMTVAVAADTTFSYQGELKESGDLATGSYDMDFSLWDAAGGGNQIGAMIMLNRVGVSEGQFVVELDFGAAAFDNAARWLEITVDGFTLDPRQKITRSPYSIQTRGIFVDDQNNVGIGTTNPQRQVDLEAPESILRLFTTNDSPTTVSRIELKSAATISAHTPLGRIDFVDENDTLRALITGLESGPVDAQMFFSVTPSDLPQMKITSTGVHFQHQIKPAVAYGTVTGGGFLESGSSNVSVTWTSTGVYRIYVDGEVLDTDVPQVTLETIGFVTAQASNGYINVRTYSNSAGTPSTNRAFSFVVYRP